MKEETEKCGNCPNFHSSTTRCFRNCPTPSPGFPPAIGSEQKYAWQIERIALKNSKCRRMQRYAKRIRNRNDEKKLCHCHSIVERQVRERSDSQAVSCHNFPTRTLYSMTLCYLSRGLALQIWANMEKQWKLGKRREPAKTTKLAQRAPPNAIWCTTYATCITNKYMSIDVCARNLAKAPCCTKALIPQRRVPNRRSVWNTESFENKKDAGFLPRFQRATERELWRQGQKPDQNLRARSLMLKWASKPAQLQVHLLDSTSACICLHCPINLKQWAVVGELIQLGERLEYEIWLLFTRCWSFLYARERKGKHPTESSKSSTFQANTTTGDFVLDVIRFEAHAKIPTPEILRERGS